ncbi:MAG: hypothetical protein HC881_17950 [Leptolyngbyaceae cyanobacterium SL_7_1]|nr:hypothetical protein [Leptolyngbyaceae cyanobacterium SL_7_1]
MKYGQWFRAGLVLATLAIASDGIASRAIAQSLADCQPPVGAELLVLVLNQTPQTSSQLEATLPPNTTMTVCNYLGREVTRVAGFTAAETASSWAQYLSEMQGLQAFVARPPEESGSAIAVEPPAASAIPLATLPPVLPSSTTPPPTVTVPPLQSAPATSLPPTVPPAESVAALMGTPAESDATPTTATPTPTPTLSVTPTPIESVAATTTPPTVTPQSTAYDPQPLGNGYAVLIDYANRPEVAIDAHQLLTRPIGLVAYQQRPFLLAVYTPDRAIATDILQTLSDNNFTAVLVDSRSAILLTPTVAVLD